VFLDVVVNRTDGTPSDLTDYLVRAQVRATPNATLVLATWTPTIVGNTIHLLLLGSESRALPLQTVWDVEITSPAGVVTTLAAGSISMKAQVTR
jgi:hypothetical protein